MDINLLKTFVTVAREGSITRASEQLYLSQPAVSAHIKAIEETLALNIFERTPKGMILTPDGQRLLSKAEETLASHRSFFEEASRLKGRLTGRLNLGAGSNSSNEALGRLLTVLSERCPGVEVVITHGNSQEVLNGIRNGSLDAGFYNEPGDPDPILNTVETARFAIYLAAPIGLVDTGQPLDWTALEKLPWLFPSSSNCCGKAAEELFKKHQIQPERIISIDREKVTRTLIAGGVGIGLLHADEAQAAEDCAEVDLLCEARKSVRVLFAHLAGRAQDPVLKVVRTLFQEELTP